MRGEFEHVIDEKGRMFIPSKFRAELGCRFVLTKSVNNCLVAYPTADWEAFEAKLKSYPSSKSTPLLRFFVGSSQDMELDGQGRVLVPQKLRSYAGLEKNIVVVGMIDHLEIWVAEAWENGIVSPETAGELMEELGI